MKEKLSAKEKQILKLNKKKVDIINLMLNLEHEKKRIRKDTFPSELKYQNYIKSLDNNIEKNRCKLNILIDEIKRLENK